MFRLRGIVLRTMPTSLNMTIHHEWGEAGMFRLRGIVLRTIPTSLNMTIHYEWGEAGMFRLRGIVLRTMPTSLNMTICEVRQGCFDCVGSSCGRFQLRST
jgi:hypothetical protein